eukprot:2592530-Amphidinium_carterae.1
MHCARELFQWLVSVPSLDSFWLQSSLPSLAQLQVNPALERLRVTCAARDGGLVQLPLEGWLQRGAWASWASALTTLRAHHLASYADDGVVQNVRLSTIRLCIREVQDGTSRVAHRAL